MIKFPSIEQFRSVIKEVRLNHDYQGKDEQDQPVYQHLSDYPKIDFQGTVKIHGTNGCVCKYKDRIEFQSRERVLTLQQDNAQFMLNMMGKNLDFLFDGFEFEDHIAVFGEWCGKGVQSGIAVSELPRMFVIFACNIDGVWHPYLRSDHSQLIYNIQDFPTWSIEVNFNQPELVQNTLIDITNEIEKECPVGKYFGISGIGEGAVYTSIDRRYSFKVKGEKHSSTKVKTLAEVDTEMIESMNQFVEYALTENRLKQGLSKLEEMGFERSQKSTGEYLRWIVNDIIKEEEDVIVKSGLDSKKLNSLISNKARQWYFNNI